MRKHILISAFLFVLSLNVQAQEIIRNLGFEQINPNGEILCWSLINTKQKYEVKLDTTVSHGAKTSLVLTSLPRAEADRGYAGAESVIITSVFKVKRVVKVSAFVKTKDVKDGIAGLSIALFNKDKNIGEANSGNLSRTGTGDWAKIEVELPLTTEVAAVRFGVVLTGTGKAWFDDIEISVDGKVIASSTYEDKDNFRNAN